MHAVITGLVVGADQETAEAIEQELRQHGLATRCFPATSLPALRDAPLPFSRGMVFVAGASSSAARDSLLNRVRELHPGAPVVMLSCEKRLFGPGRWMAIEGSRRRPLAEVVAEFLRGDPAAGAGSPATGVAFAELLEHHPDACFVTDRAGRLLAVNASGGRLLRRDPRSLAGRVLVDHLPESLAARIRPGFQRWLRKGGGAHYHHSVSTEEAGLPCDLTAARAVFDGRPAALVTVRDLSARCHVEQWLREARGKFQTLLEQLPAITYALEFKGMAPRALYVSSPVESLLGYRRREWLADPSLSHRILHPDDRDRVIAEVCRHIDGLQPFDVEFRMIARDGRVVWFRNHARWVRAPGRRERVLQGVLIDITDRRNAEDGSVRRGAILEAVRMAGETLLRTPGWTDAVDRVLAKLGEAAEVSRVYLFERTSRPGESPVLVSQRAEWTAPGIRRQIDNPALQEASLADPRFGRLLEHLERGEPRCGRVRDVPPEERAFLRQQDVLSIAEVPILVGGNWWGFIGFDDCRRERTWTEAEVDALRAAAHQLGAAIERQRTDQDLRESQERLRQAQKMESLGLLAGGIAHDFNNLLTVILGCAHMARRRFASDDPTLQEMDEITGAGERAAELIRELLTFSRKQVAEVRRLDVNQVVRDMDRLLRRTLGEHIELVTLPGGKAPTIEADPGQLGQVLMNLCVNARDAMPQGGRLTILTDVVYLNRDFCRAHPGLPEGRYVQLAVRDTGIGMPDEVRRRAFDPFFTTKAAGQGVGMGLATVYSIVKQCRGHIEINSAPGAGAEVMIYLPEAAGPAPAPEPASEPSAPGGDETVLLVEDEPNVRRMTRTMLESLGYRVLEAMNGPEAIRIVRPLREPLHLALTDVIMPHMNGPELIRRLQVLRPEIKVLCMSGFPGEALQTQSGILPPLLRKPFNRDELAVKVRQVLDDKAPGILRSQPALDP
jgi:PAS domain S-box-containing protein